MFIDTFLDKVKAALSSPVCLHCGQKSLAYQDKFCNRCTERLGLRVAQPVVTGADFVCHAATHFNPAIRKLLYHYKFQNREENVLELAGLLIQYWQTLLPASGFQGVHPENILVVPVPPHVGQESRVHGFASRFARHFGYDYAPDALGWARSTKLQHTLLEKGQRFKNIADSMQVRNPRIAEHQHLIIVDDLTTTGATLQEANRALRAGLEHTVEVITLAVSKVPLRAQLDDQAFNFSQSVGETIPRFRSSRASVPKSR